MSNPLNQLDYYTLLQIEDDAPITVVKKAFRSFARRYHPDRFIDASPKKRERASEIYRRGSEAYQVLTDPDERKAYDQVLLQGQLRLSPEERDRAGIPEEEVVVTEEDQITSPQAKRLFRQAVELEETGQLRDAWKLFDAAGRQEPDNPIIEGRLVRISGRIRSGL